MESDRTSGAFEYSYVDATGVHDAVGAVYNYTMALGSVRHEDKSGLILLGVLHKVRFFAAPRIEAKQQKRMIMDLFNDMLLQNAARGRSMEPPLNFKEVMDLAKEKLNEASLDGIASVMGVECYGGSRKETNSKAQGGNKGQEPKHTNSKGYGQGRSNNDRNTRNQMADVCWDFNGKKGKGGCSFNNCK